jgi:anti-anti-sigma factor
MEFASGIDGDLVQLHVSGNLDSITSPDLTRAVNVAMEAGARRLIFDMRDVRYVSSAGLRVILIAAKQAQSAGGGVAVFGLQTNVAQVFAISGFDKVIAIAASDADARDSLQAARG